MHTQKRSQIDLAAHVGGALSGALVAYLWGPRYVWPGTPGDTWGVKIWDLKRWKTIGNHRKLCISTWETIGK